MSVQDQSCPFLLEGQLPARWRREVDGALRAACWAGALLREEADRPGGPRGSGGHAEIDEEVEWGIHDFIAENFPEDGWLGEETGVRIRPGTSGRVWVVDPNDGTREFLQGFRGPAVSVALVAEGIPVLGVVYAYNHPDDRGDLIVGVVEGGFVFRNGVRVERLWREIPSDEALVIVAPGGEKNPVANLQCAHPLRFRVMPSIAYRLALAAVDEGDVGFALMGPVSWDVAGGHAILLAAGGDLYGVSGTPLRYDRRGEFPGQSLLLGGPRGLVEHLRSKDWSRVTYPKSDGSPSALCRPLRSREALDPHVLARAQGCLLGQLAGDALGSLVEFESPEDIRRLHPGGVRDLVGGGPWGTIAGQPTDDSEMALALARTLVADGSFRVDHVAQAYRAWLASDPFDVGHTTRQALLGEPQPDSQANGALMRISPLGIFGAFCSPEDVAFWAAQDAVLTHIHPICSQASALFARAVAHAIRNGGSGEGLFDHMARWAEEGELDPAIRQLFPRIARRERPVETVHAGWVLVALQNALWHLRHSSSLEEALEDTVMRGGDADTNAAICGALLGAVFGRDGVPQRWQKRLFSCRPAAGVRGVLHPRPDCYWPVDALMLAERLLRAGMGR